MNFEPVELDEASVIEKDFESLARQELSLLVLALDSILSAAAVGLLV